MARKQTAPAPARTDETSGAWQLSIPCTRAQAEAIEDGEPALASAVLSLCELDEAAEKGWRLDIIFDHEPESDEIEAALALVPDTDPRDAALERLPDTDWVTQSQSGLDPVVVGRFHIRHDAAAPARADHVDFLIPASRAFGTGQHQTTAGCLLALDALARSGHRFGNVADIGTGTGLLAFAALSLWPRAHALASDIDPVAIEVTAENAALNGVTLGAGKGRLALVPAPGVDDALITGLAPYDLLIANILAGPLVTLAPGLCAQIAEGGSLILAGLLESQAEAVIAAYRRQGMRLAARYGHGSGEWPTLHLRKRRRHGWRRQARWRADAHGDAPGFGSW